MLVQLQKHDIRCCPVAHIMNEGWATWAVMNISLSSMSYAHLTNTMIISRVALVDTCTPTSVQTHLSSSLDIGQCGPALMISARALGQPLGSSWVMLDDSPACMQCMYLTCFSSLIECQSLRQIYSSQTVLKYSSCSNISISLLSQPQMCDSLDLPFGHDRRIVFNLSHHRGW